MKTLFDVMCAHVDMARELGYDILCWTIRTDMYPDVEREARAAGAQVEGEATILGVPFKLADHVETENGALSMLTGPVAARPQDAN